MKNTLQLILIFLIQTVVFSQSEKKIDSLLVILDRNDNYVDRIKILNKICIEYNKSNTDKFELYNLKILEISKKNNYQVGYGLYFLNCSFLNIYDQNQKQALELAKKSIYIFKKENDLHNYLRAIKITASILINLNEVENSKLLLNQNLELALKHKDNDIIIDFYSLIAINFSYRDSIAKSLINYKKALLFSSRNKSESKSNLFHKISDQYTVLMQNEKALFYINLAVDNRENNYQFLVEAKKALILNELGNHNEALNLSLKNYNSIKKYKMTAEWQYNLILYNIANAYYKLKKYDLAEPYINLVIDKKNTIPEYKIECFVILSNIFFDEKKKKEAQFFSNKAFIFHDSLYKQFGNFEFYSNRYKIEEDAKNYKKANYFYQKQINFITKRSSQINNETNILLQTDFDVALKDKNIRILQEQKAKSTIENLKQKNYIMLFGGLFLATLLSVLFFIKINLTIKKKNKIIESEKLLTQKSLFEKEILLKEIHHRVKNNMQTVISLLKIQSLDEKESTIADFVSVSEARINSMILIHENLYLNETLDKICFEDYLSSLKQSIIVSQKSSNNIALDVVVNKVCLDIQTAIPIGLIINELVTNAYKHAFNNKDKGQILIQLIQTNTETQLIISDDGSGISSCEIKKNSLGLELVKLLVSQIKGVIETDNSSGTRYTIRFKSVII